MYHIYHSSIFFIISCFRLMLIKVRVDGDSQQTTPPDVSDVSRGSMYICFVHVILP